MESKEMISSLVRKPIQEIGYLRNCSKNVKELQLEVDMLKHMRKRVEQNLDLAQSKGDDILDGVLAWIDGADAKIHMAEEFLTEEANAKRWCFNLRWCINCKTLHNSGKTAKSMAQSLRMHRENGQSFESCVSIPYLFYQKKILDRFDTQKFTLNKIIEAIKDENIQIIGVYGVGGVGKTTLAIEVAATVKNLFSCVVFITVPRPVNHEMIQKEVEVATKRVHKGEKVLIILDDVWEKLMLYEVGIPCGINYKNCKILLTSRMLDVCRKMEAQRMIYVDCWAKDEAWNLFKQVVGESVETDQVFKKIGMDIVQFCGGLPLLINVIGKALKNESTSIWETALIRLHNPATKFIDPEISKAFSSIRLSYDLLENEEAKSCFLLCSLFPEDAHIPLERLTRYGVGARIFNALPSIEDARNRVQVIVEFLKSSSFLLDTNSKFTTKLHQIVHDAALLIASEGKNNFLVKSGTGLTEWFPRTNSVESYTGISLMHNNIHKLPHYGLHLPLLDTLLVQENRNLSLIPDDFLRSIINAKVLDMENNNISSLPLSLELLTQLRYLNLGGNRSLQDIVILGELLALEILILNDTGIIEVPKEIGQLVHLRLLEAKRCLNLSHIAPGVISRLRLLEEFHIGYYGKNSYNSSLLELNNLEHLTFLDLFVLDFDFIISQDSLLEKLKGFMIQIGGTESISQTPHIPQAERRLIIKTPSIPLLRSNKLVKVSHMHLQSTENLYNLLPTLSYEGFTETKSISLSSCNNVLCLVDTKEWHFMQTVESSRERLFSKVEHISLQNLINLEVLWNCPHQFITFSNLATLKISVCPKLRSLFPVSVAQDLANLRILEITFCDSLESVIRAEEEGTSKGETEIEVHDTCIVLPCLTSITLVSLGQLKSFCSVHSSIKYPCLESLSVGYCTSMTIWGNGVHDMPMINFQHEGTSYSLNDIMPICSKANQLMTFKAHSTSSM